MIDDQNIDSKPLRQQNFFVRVDSVIDRDEKIGPSLGELVNRSRVQAIPFIPVGQVGTGLNAEIGENIRQNVRAEDSVTVVVAVDRNLLFLPNGSEHALDTLRHARDGVRIRKVAPGWSFNKRIDVLNSARDEDVEQWLAQKHTASSRPGSGVLSVVELKIGQTRPST